MQPHFFSHTNCTPPLEDRPLHSPLLKNEKIQDQSPSPALESDYLSDGFESPPPSENTNPQGQNMRDLKNIFFFWRRLSREQIISLGVCFVIIGLLAATFVGALYLSNSFSSEDDDSNSEESSNSPMPH